MVSEFLLLCLCPLSVGDSVTVVLTIGRTHKLHRHRRLLGLQPAKHLNVSGRIHVATSRRGYWWSMHFAWEIFRKEPTVAFIME